MKKILYITFFIVIYLVLCPACTKKFAEYNTNPNNITDEDLNKDNLFLGSFIVKMIQSVFPYGGTGSTSTNSYQLVENLCGDAFAGYNGQTHNWSNSGDQLSYNFSLGWNGAPFSILYTGVMGNWKIVKQKTELSNPDLYSVAQIIKIYAAQRVTDTYGPIPYSKAGEGIGAPYDTQKDIYYSFFKELDEAIEILKPYAVQGVTPLSLFDDIYKGDYNKWIKFANTLRLRLAMRIVYADAAKAKEEAMKAVNDSFGLIDSNDNNAIVRGIPESNRIYGNPLSGLSEGYNEARMSANMESFLVGYNDPRLEALFYPATDQDNPDKVLSPLQYHGVRVGIRINDKQSKYYVSCSKLKTDFKIVWMTAAESYFLRAEGAIRGWDMKGNAKDLYEEGVKKSFEQWGIKNVSQKADNYLSDSESLPKEYKDIANSSNSVSQGKYLSTITIAWNESDSFEKKLEKIITQKWIALYPNGQEAWSEFRRTGYPKIFPVALNYNSSTINTDKQIRRLPYPLGEFRNNKKNYDDAVLLLGGMDNGGTKLWWDKK